MSDSVWQTDSERVCSPGTRVVPTMYLGGSRTYMGVPVWQTGSEQDKRLGT